MDKLELKACEYTIHRLVKEMLRTNTKAIHGTYTDDENKEYEDDEKPKGFIEKIKKFLMGRY